MLREAGAIEVHVRISSPPVKWPCFYGIDFATRAELLANGLDTEGIRRSIGADSLGYVSLEGLIAAIRAAKDAAVPSVFRRRVPDPVAGRRSDRKHVLEGVQRRVATAEDAGPGQPVAASPGGEGARGVRKAWPAGEP